MDDYTRKFNAAEDRDEQVHHVLTSVYEALKEKGYDPVNQIVGYILSEDPTYITNHNGARTLFCTIDRDELLQILVKRYLDIGRENRTKWKETRRFLSLFVAFLNLPASDLTQGLFCAILVSVD